MKEKEEQRLKLLKEEENKLYESNKIRYICGIDEAGRRSTCSGLLQWDVL